MFQLCVYIKEPRARSFSLASLYNFDFQYSVPVRRARSIEMYLDGGKGKTVKRLFLNAFIIVQQQTSIRSKGKSDAG